MLEWMEVCSIIAAGRILLGMLNRFAKLETNGPGIDCGVQLPGRGPEGHPV